MAIVADLGLVSPVVPLGHASRAVPDAVVRIEYEGELGELLVSVTGDDLDAFEAALEADPTVATVRSVTTFDGRRLYGLTLALDRPPFTGETLADDIEVLVDSIVDGHRHLTLELPDADALSAVRAACREHGLTVRVDRLYVERPSVAADEGFGLTEAQQRALVAAHERGYFEDPRDVTLAELAAALDVSPSALGRRMRRGLAALIEHTLRADR